MVGARRGDKGSGRDGGARRDGARGRDVPYLNALPCTIGGDSTHAFSRDLLVFWKIWVGGLGLCLTTSYKPVLPEDAYIYSYRFWTSRWPVQFSKPQKTLTVSMCGFT